ncbi:hypothetical protein H632_c942p0 [Helicosporidium sp. ATCC 50920]|nr:hypothetical protein H632_c942p0 [Helicosporidium sp. ATCC 50920]|eukprot:KDD74988.1 hypothetical protein H632_c942p0 [Helicosporidium sp. ATCC 50920]
MYWASESRKDATELETMTSTAGKNVATNDQASLLEMEDEFEEFELEDWDPSSEDVSNEQLWERDWDDDMPAEDFAQQLHEELAKGAK